MIIKKLIFLIYIIFIKISYSQILHINYLKKYTPQIFKMVCNYYFTLYRTGFSSPVYYSGDIITTNNKIDIFIGNHYNYIDFMVQFGIFSKLNDKEICFVYSKYLQSVPVVGRLFRNLKSLALNKKIHLDIDNIKNFISKNNNTILHLYPEGTRITYDKLNKSKEFSKKNNYPEYNNLLFPKMKGLFVIINELHKQNKLGNIVDFTIKTEGVTKNDNSIFSYLNKNLGNTYVKINTYKCEHFDDYNKFKKWFLMIWDKKEDYLNNYYNLKKYNYIQLESKLETSTKIITVLTIIIFLWFFYFIHIKKLSLKCILGIRSYIS